MTDRGYTLIELLIVLAIIAILLIALAMSYQGWRGKYRVESQTQQLYTDLMEARARAMQRNRAHFVDFTTRTTYAAYDDDSDGAAKVPDGDGLLQTGTGASADTRLPGYPKTVEYQMTYGTSGQTAAQIDMDRRGIITAVLGGAASPSLTICLFTDTDGDGASDLDPDYDCLAVSETRINMGKLNSQAAGDCDANHCIEK
ncbi:MAG: GspH/FimT family pseudopilin [Thermodesulfovibrionales bacterium]